jgi:hypothetical protein
MRSERHEAQKERMIMNAREEDTTNTESEPQEEAKNRGPDADIYAVIKRKGLEKGLWKKIGVAFRNRDGSANLRFDFYPRDPETGLQLRWKEDDDDSN